MAAKDSSKSSKSRKGGSRSSQGGSRKSASRTRSGEDDSKRKSSKGASASRGEGGGRKGAAKKTSRSGGDESRGGGRGGQGGRGEGGRAAQGGARGRKSESRSEGGGGARKAGARKSAERSDSGARGRKAASGGRGRGRMDALKMLKEDHERVDEMFKRYDRMKEGDERKQQLLQMILEEVRVHAQVEEELFYPALGTLFEEEQKDKEKELIDEASVEHETVKWLMEQLEGEQSDEGTRDARVKVMGEYIRHHVEEEEGQIFKAAKRVDLDLEELGRQMDARKRQLKGEEPADQEGMGAGELEVSEPAAMATTGSRTH